MMKMTNDVLMKPRSLIYKREIGEHGNSEKVRRQYQFVLAVLAFDPPQSYIPCVAR